MNTKFKRWIYAILIVVLLGWFFYVVLEKDEAEEPDVSQEDSQNEEMPVEEEEPIDDELREEPVPEENVALPDSPQSDVEIPIIEVGEKLPDFTLESLDGEEVNLRGLEGKKVLINFWATWCPWCDKEMGDLDKLDKENEDLIVIGVNVDESKSQVEEYVKEGGYDLKVLLDEGGLISTEYFVTGLPASYFVNEEGIFTGRVPSYMTYEDMNEALQFTKDY